MLEHRNLCRTYGEAYRSKLTSKKISNDLQQSIDFHEERLDLFNLLLIRNQVDLELEKSGKLQEQDLQKSSWFGGWFGGGKSNENDDTNKDICK